MNVLEKLKQAEHWHRSKFIAKCAQSVLPLFDKAWPDALLERKAAIERTIQLTLTGAHAKLIPPDLESACLECRIVAGKALRPLNPDGPFQLKEPAPLDAESCNLAHFVASAAAWAADSLAADSEQAPQNAIYAFGFAVDAAQCGLSLQVVRRLESLVSEFQIGVP